MRGLINKLLFNKYTLIGSLILIIIVLFTMVLNTKSDVSRWKANSLAKNNTIEYLTYKDSVNVAKSRVFELTVSEIKDLYPNLKKELSEIKVKLRNTELITNNTFETKTNINTILRDSLINDTISVKVFDYTDKFLSLYSIQYNDSVNVSVSYVDSLTQILYWERPQDKGIIQKWFGKKTLFQKVALQNPHSLLKYNETIKVK